MGRSPCCSKEQGVNKGAWTPLEDAILTDYINRHGLGKWRNIPKLAGLKRCGKSCRLRWLNYLRPDIKRGNITPDEEDLILRLHKLLGNRWSLIAGRLPGRTDNEIKNYWNTVLSKKSKPQDDARKRSDESGNQAAESSDDKSSGVEVDIAMDFNQLVDDIDLSEFLNADYSENAFGSLDMFLDEHWMI